VWLQVQDLVTKSQAAYSKNHLGAFYLALIASITAYESAEKNMVQYRGNFAAYSGLWLQSIFGPSSPEFKTISSAFNDWKREAEEVYEGDVHDTGKQEEGCDNVDGDAERFYVDMKLMCDGKSFFFTEKGYFGLGSWIANPGNRVCVLSGSKT